MIIVINYYYYYYHYQIFMFPDQYGKHILEFHVRNEHMSLSPVTITDSNTNKVLHQRIVEVWAPEKKMDYFYRTIVIDTNNKISKYSVVENAGDIKYIIFTSYNGLEVWNSKLDRIFFLEISPENKYEDVYSADIIDGHLYTWSANNGKKFVKSNFDTTYGERYEYLVKKHDSINDDINAQLKDLPERKRCMAFLDIRSKTPEYYTIRNELMNLDKFRRHDYISSTNVPNSIMTKHMNLFD